MCVVQPLEADHPADFGCAQAGCSDCMERLLREHASLISLIVLRQWPGQADYADLIQEGWIGLWQAILRFEPGRGFAFSTFAWKDIRNRVWYAVKLAAKVEGWLEPQRAGDRLARILAAWQ